MCEGGGGKAAFIRYSLEMEEEEEDEENESWRRDLLACPDEKATGLERLYDMVKSRKRVHDKGGGKQHNGQLCLRLPSGGRDWQFGLSLRVILLNALL